ncbi:uncharacterized protein UHOD_12127 [Ustilago sp. UG-2017b]|nr:uncharacterized protein UHOD_12127 [Ustilago sp. UG-2017b]
MFLLPVTLTSEFVEIGRIEVLRQNPLGLVGARYYSRGHRDQQKLDHTADLDETGCSKKALGSYGRSIGARDQADPQRSRPWPMDKEMLEKAWSECNLHGECSLHGDHGHGGPGRMHGDPSTATRRTELKEHTDGSHSGARETRVKGTVTGQREGVVYRRPARPASKS